MALAIDASKSLARRRLRLTHASARSTSQRRGSSSVQLQSGLGALPGLALDCLNRPPGCGLGRGHAGGRQRLHRHRQSIGERDLVGLRALPEIDHASSFFSEAQRHDRRGLHREPGVVGARLLCFLIQERAPAWTVSAIRGILSCMGRATTHVYEVSAPDGDVLGLVRAPSAGRALRRINELCGVPCTVLGRRVFFDEQHRRDCAGPWQVRSVRLSVKAPTLMTRNYVLEGPTAVFIAQAPRCPALRASSRSSCDRQIHPPISGQV